MGGAAACGMACNNYLAHIQSALQTYKLNCFKRTVAFLSQVSFATSALAHLSQVLHMTSTTSQHGMLPRSSHSACFQDGNRAGGLAMTPTRFRAAW